MIRSPLLIDSLIFLLFHLHARDSRMIEIEKLTKRQIPSNAEVFRALIIEVITGPCREKGSFYFSWSSLRSEGGLKSQIFRREKGSFYFSWSSLRSEGGLKSQIFRSAGSPGFGSEGCAATYAVTQSRQFLFGHRTIHSGRPVRVAWLP